jgi:hypothetical protein
MRLNSLKAKVKAAVLGAAVLLFGVHSATAQVTVNLSAGPANAVLPDGNAVPMWGYTCTTANDPNCHALNSSAGAGWSPVVITVPTGQSLTINLTNNLSFGANKIPTSLVIVGQLGGGLGSVGTGCTGGATCTDPPDHSNAQGATTWPIAGGAGVTPPTQGRRVQSFGTEVAAGATTALAWGVTGPALRPGTYLIESGTHPSIQGPMGLYGILVVTTAPVIATTTPGTAYPGVAYNAEVPLLLGEIDPVQNNAVTTDVNTTGFSETMVWSGLTDGCGNPASSTYHQCYPPAVNYTPLYYTINGVAFDKTANTGGAATGPSLFGATPTGVSGTVLVRMVNAGLRMHVPSIVGAQTGTTPTPGFSLIAEDGNPLPGLPRVQSEVFMAPGKTYDVMINVPAAGSTALPVFDRELSLSGNAIGRDTGMFGYIGVNGAALPSAGSLGAAVARDDPYPSLLAGQTLTVSDPAKGVIANDTNVYGVTLLTQAGSGTVTLNANGTFTYVPSGTGTTDSFTYCANGTVTAGACSSGVTATVSLSGSNLTDSGVTCNALSFNSKVATYMAQKTPGLLAGCKDGAKLPLTVVASSIAAPATVPAGATAISATCTATVITNCVLPDANGGFSASVSGAGTYAFAFKAQNSHNQQSTATTVTLVFPAGSGLTVKVFDGTDKTTQITDYRWIIEEDRTFYIDPNCTTNPPQAGCPSSSSGIVPTFGTNFHTSYMPVVATGCTGTLSCESGQSVGGVSAVCDVGNGMCRTSATQALQETAVDPKQVQLDPKKRYYISVLPGDAADPFNAPYSGGGCQNGSSQATSGATCGHGMGGAPIAFACPPFNPTSTACSAAPSWAPVNIFTQPTPLPTAKLSVFVFQDDFPLNGENDAGGQVADTQLGTEEPGLGGFEITLFDDAGGTGDATGQMTYDMFNMPLSNSLAGTPDPANNGIDACPISKNALKGGDGTSSPTGITSVIVTCPKYEADGLTQSPLAGQAVVANLMPGRYGVVATPAADRIARGEEWLQTNTLDGQKAHDSFLRVGEPSFFQEYGPASYHVTIGFANPAIINARLKGTTDTTGKLTPGVCTGGDPNTALKGSNCTNTIKGLVTTERMSRTPDERLYSSGTNDSFSFTQCYVSFGDPDGEDIAFTKCDKDGKFTLTGLPDGDWRVTVFDQWNDMLVDGLSTPVRLGSATNGKCPGGGSSASTCDLGEIATNQWQANIYTSTFIDTNKDGVREDGEAGLALVPTNIRFRDGSFSNFNNTDLDGNAGFNEVFPLFSWYVIETDNTRYKNTGTHVVYDAGGPADGTPGGGTSNIAQNMANTLETISVPSSLRVPGAVYCASADCTNKSIANGPASSDATCSTDTSTGQTTCSHPLSTGRIDPPWVVSEGWQGFSGQNSFLEFGKTPYAAGENGGIRGHVVYASTRPFDDPQLLLQTSWEPLVPNVTINLYQEGTASDGSTQLTLVDSTQTSSFDDWAQGFRSDGNPNMNCPGQGRDTGPNADLFFFSLLNQPDWLDVYNNGGTPAHTIPNNSQFKCYDGMHNWNQLQPAPYDGMYQFPSIAGRNPTTGAPVGGTGSVAGTNCLTCVVNPTDGTPMLPAGKYVVEVVVPPGFELVKEEDKNILIGDNYIAPVTQQFGGLSNIFILPDQAAVDASYNANNAQNSTSDLGRTTFPSKEADTGSMETFWPCVGESRVVPDYISLFPQSKEVAPFAGATRPLCDRKEVTLDDQSAALAKFYIFTSTHAAAHFTGIITDDFTSEFDPFSPQFGEKFSPADLPISIKDWSGTEISRIYADHWGAYNGLTYSTWEVNPPNPTGYAPTMMITCMNDPGTGATPDPLYNPQYSDFCYEIPFMPGQTQYMDTPVTPTSAFAGAGYNNPDCAYPAATPAIAEVDSNSGLGPWVSAGGTGHTLTITALGNQQVPNNAYSGPSATTAPYNQKTVARHYGFGARCTAPAAGSATCNTLSSVTIGGAPATISSWNDNQIVVTVPATGTATGQVHPCAVQQQTQFGGSQAFCGELAITAGNGRQSIDAVTVTIGGKAPTHVAPTASIQSAIDIASPGDLIIVNPTAQAGCTLSSGAPTACDATGAMVHLNSAAHSELLLMWKPVRLQGVGAASSIIDGGTHPAGKLNDWRARVNCLFGLGLSGTPKTWSNSCATGWKFFTGNPTNPQVDRLPLEAVVGWSATLNGNLAQLLQEPTLMGALEGAAITVLAKGVHFPTGSDPFAADTFPVGTTLLTNSTSTTTGCGSTSTTQNNPSSSNFLCNPSSIDGLGIRNSSQGGGGIFVHAWGHKLQITNNRVNNNAGTLAGGINVGQGEFPPPYIKGGATNADPNSCLGLTSGALTGLLTATQVPTGAVEPYCHNVGVIVQNNSITSNSSTGDELFSATPAGAGGISFCTGADFYKFNFNWVCGNLSTGDGGGLGHLGVSYNGDIEHNTVIFNQSINPTIPANGGGMIVMGAPDADPTCTGAAADVDCLTAPGAVGPSDGIGSGLVINANLIMGNSAESGTGGGIAFQNVNGSDVVAFPTSPNNWWAPSVTNNIIVNNVAGWDGGGVSLLDTLNINVFNNTIASNDTTASAGPLFNTLGAPLASQQGPCPSGQTDPNSGSCLVQVTASTQQPAGLVSIQNSAILTANLPATITCPTNHFAPNTSASNGSCRKVSYPLLDNNMFWQNSTYHIGVGPLGSGTLNQQNLVTLYNGSTTTPAPSQSAADGTTAHGNGSTITGGSGACVAASYWDIGVRGDTAPGDHSSTITLAPNYSVLTNPSENGLGTNNLLGDNPNVVSQYCNGSRQPPESCTLPGGCGWDVPPGISDATVPNPVFNLTPAATVDEGNNWINMRWGPLSMVHPVSSTSTNSVILGNYAQSSGSPVINYIPSNAAGVAFSSAPSSDFLGNARKTANNPVDVGAVEFQGAVTTAIAFVTPSPLDFGNVPVTGTAVTAVLTLRNDGGASVTGITIGALTGVFSRTTTCPASGTLAAGTSCTITVSYTPTTINATSNASLTITGSVAIDGAPVAISGTGVAVVRSASVSPASLAFGNQADFSTSAAQTITVTNTGNTALAAQTFTINPATGFARATGGAAGTCGAALAAGAQCTYGVVFSPTLAQAYNSTLTVGYAPAATVTYLSATGTSVPGPVALSGTGTAIGRLAFTAATNGTLGTVLGVPTLTFTVPTNRSAVTSTVTITNTGTGPLQITAETVTNLIGTNFARGTTTCSFATPLAAAGACNVNITYTPPATAPLIPRAGALSVNNNGAGTVGGASTLGLVGR